MKHLIKIFVCFFLMNTYAQTDEIFIQTINATKDYQGIFGSATLQIDDAGSDGAITNPLIIVEGLDTGLLAQAGSIGDSDLRTLIRNIEDAESDNLSDLLTGGNILANGDQDYDIIYVNWNNGTDFIQRNAFVLEAVIEWVNEQKALSGSTNKNVVLGQSMGGLIARYALRDMENTGLNHHTSLYISHDAPHQGAHLPLGMLYMARDVVNEFIETPLGDISIPVEGGGNVGLGTIDDLLDAPAINQMLITTVDTNGNRTNTVHTNWQNELRSFGYPGQTRNIALSNASHCASNQGLISNQELVTVAGNGGTSDLTSLLMFTMLPVDQLIGEALNDVSASLLGFLPGNSSLDLEFRVNAFPSSGTARIYKGRLTYKKTFLWLLPITRTIFDNSDNSQNGDKFIDNYPGGVTPNALAISEGAGSTNWFYNYDYDLNVNLNFNFISATSALDVGSGNALLTDIDYFKIYTAANPPTGTKTIPFANFSTSSSQNNSLNAPHISFNRRNGDWLATELDANANNNQIFDCSYICSTREPNWADFICTSQMFSSPVIRQDATYSWSISEGGNLVTATGASTQNFTLTDKNTGTGWLRINLSVDTPTCGLKQYTKRIWVGLPTIRQPLDCATNPLNDPSCTLTLCKSNEYLVNNLIRIEAVGLAHNSTYLDWEWVKISNNFNWNTAGANGSIRIQASQTGPVVFKVRAKNACGWTP
ncbi:hypothetical protein ACI6PS_16030, partial [Flavobacterium sp. PLA-1-15]|uniref:hypothetical protein n=1 Tax=Flavobacterium sp. PLA-1-15 TaxID=3380533 RepID=UPI003B8018D8